MEAEEFVQMWHASFGKAQPPEWVCKLNAQDVGNELRACETRVQALQQELKREQLVLEWLRRIATERPSCEGVTSDSRRLPEVEGERGEERVSSQSPSSPSENRPSGETVGREEEEKVVDSLQPPEAERTNPSLALSRTCSPVDSQGSRGGRRGSGDGLESQGSSEYFSAQPEESSKAPTPETGRSETALVEEIEKSRQEGERERVEEDREEQVRKRFVHKVNSSDKRVAKAVKRRLIEQGRWWSSNLVSLDPSSRTHSPATRRRSVSEPLECHSQLTTTFSPEQKESESPSEEVSEGYRLTGDKGNDFKTKSEVVCTSGVNSSVLETDHKAPNEAEERVLNKARFEKEESTEESTQPVDLVPQTVDRANSEDSELVPQRVNRANSEDSVPSSLEEEGSITKLDRRKSSIEAKLQERRRSGGWKVVEVTGGQRKPSKNKQEQEKNSTQSNGVVPQEEQMLKAAKEKLSRVTSSPPLRRRPSREREKRRSREGNQHRTSNGQLETPPALVEEVMVERRVEKSDSLLSEIMAHRFSNGLDGAQLLESGEHSLVSSQEEAAHAKDSSTETGKTAPAVQPSETRSADSTPKVILRRRSEREVDPLPEAKRRSSYLEDDDCSTPKEELPTILCEDENLEQGLTRSMVEAITGSKPRVARMDSDSTLRQDSLEATLTPASAASNVNYRMSYMTAVRESPQISFMPHISEGGGPRGGGHAKLTTISSEPNLLEMELTTRCLEDSMELDEATISAVTLNNELFGSRSNSVSSLPETLEDVHSSSATSLSEEFSSPVHQVVNLRSNNSGGRRKNRKRMGNAELDQTGASLEEMLSSEGVVSPNNTMSSRSSSSPVSEVSIPMTPSPSETPPFNSPTHMPHEVESQPPGSTRSSRIYPVRRSTVVVQGEKLVIRKLVVAGIVSAEKSYLDCLNVMKELYRKPLLARSTTAQPIITERDINTIFYRTEDLVELHSSLHEKLEPQLSNWTVHTCVGDFFVDLCKNLKLYKDYVEFYRQSLECLDRCKAENAAFKKFLEDVRATVMTHYKDVPRVNELLRRPIERLQSYSLVLNDLCQHTPEEHKDYSVLRQSLYAMSAFIASTHDPQSFRKLSGGFNRELVKEGLMVELSEGIRKVRRVFLFHDVIISSKQKPTRTGMKFELKWFLPLSALSFHPPEESSEAGHRPVPATSDMELSVMKNRIAELKAQLQVGKENTRDRSGSQPEREGSFRRGRGGIRAIYTMKTNRAERVKKKLQEQQVSYWMAFPSLPLRLYGDMGRQYVFLLHSDGERENWISSIKKLQPKASKTVNISAIELQDLLNHQTITELRKIEELTLPVLEDEYLSGLLRVRIMSATDLKAKPAGLYCCLELDEYGKFERKAKTLPVPTDPTTLAVAWDQDFELEVAGAHIVKVTICSKQLLKEECYAHGKIRLPIQELRSNKRHKCDITLYPQGSIQLIIEYYSSVASRDRKPAMLSSGVFGVPIEVVAKRERHDIPLIVETCVEEVERRGMSEVGIYRVAGVLRDVNELREAFDTDYLKAQVIAFEADIHAVAGLLKKYFRELPDPLFTDSLYLSFVQGMGLSDPEAREQCLITLLYSLPSVNLKTAIFLFKHLRRVAADSSSNKMNLNNLATLFGPNLLRPAPPASSGQAESLLNMAAVDVATPVNVLMYFLSCPEEYLDETLVHTSPPSTASTGRGKKRDSRMKPAWTEEEDGGSRSSRAALRNSGRHS